ncbi:MAG: hypothetical protein GX753_02050 [Erysipelothrix sp.]|nr:hypothetical protein [Erysipelothrix sp.]
MQVFNTRALTQKQRFVSAIAVGIPTTIILGIVAGKVTQFIGVATGFGFAIINIGAAYLLAMVIQKVGRGVQQRFSTLGAVLAVVLVLISEMISYGMPLIYILHLDSYRFVLSVWLNSGISGFLSIIYNAIAVYTAYSYSRFL